MSRIVQVKVQEIRPGGLLVRILFDGRNGYIRRRELSWDRRVQAQFPMPAVGTLLEAKLIDDPAVLHYVPLSVRQLIDPWQNAKGKYRRGQAVRGEVVNVRTNGVYVQLEPGIDAFLPVEEFSVSLREPAEFLPLLGDQVEATITRIEEGNHQIQLSVLNRLRELSQLTVEQRKQLLLTQFKEAINRPAVDNATGEQPKQRKKEGGMPQRYHSPLARFERVLIVDDEEPALLELWDFLEDAFDVTVFGTQSGSDAVSIILERSTFDLALVDMTLSGESGLEIAQKLLSVRSNLEIIFISNNPLKGQAIPSIFGRKFQFAIKQKEEIAGVIDKLLAGYWEPVTANEPSSLATDKGSFIRQLGIIAEAATPASNKLAQMLTALKKNTAVSSLFLFEVDTRSQSVAILNSAPSLSKEARRKAEENLYYSPVRNVAEEEEEFYWTNEETHRTRELQNFLSQWQFKCCLGIPIKLVGSSTRYALFLFDENVRNFDREMLDQIRISAQFLQLTLERIFIFDYMRRYEQRFTMGLLLNSLVHEAANKLDALHAQTQILPLILDQIELATTPTEQNEQVMEAKAIADKLITIKQDMASLFASYSRTVTGKLEAVDVHAVINKVVQQMTTRAREGGVLIDTQLLCQSPLVRTIQPRLEQVLTNLLLNAIQQIERHAKAFAPAVSVRGKTEILPQPGIVLVQTLCLAHSEPFPVRILVMDTGPGVHYQDQDDIFLLDTSRRKEGQGLGLFISRSLLEMMGGGLYVADSLLSLGSVFMVGLSVADPSGEK